MNANYKLLARKTGGQFGDLNSTRYSLWHDENHLLYVKCYGFSESYRRFFFADIQAIVVQETNADRVAAVLHGSAVFFWMVLLPIGFLVSWHPAVLGVSAAAALIAGVCLGVNWRRGPTCATYILTAVQRERIYPLDRTAKATRVIAELRPILNTAQGLPPDADHTAEAAPNQATSSRSPMAATPAAARRATLRKRPPRVYRSSSHRFLFAALLLNVCACYFRFVVPGPHMLAVAFVVWSAIVASLVWSAATQIGSDLWARIQVLAWLTPAYLSIHAAAAVVFVTFVGIENLDYGLTWSNMVDAATVSPFESPLLLGTLVFAAVCSAALGIFGHLLLNDFGRQRRRGADSEEAPAS